MRVTLHLVSSLDGFIAKKDNSISWMDSPGDVYEKGVTDDSAETLQSIDCYVLGSRTYEHALELGWPYGDTPTVVVTSRHLPSKRKSVEFYSGDLQETGKRDTRASIQKHLARRRGDACARVFSASAWWMKSDCRLSLFYWVTGYACLTTPLPSRAGVERT